MHTWAVSFVNDSVHCLSAPSSLPTDMAMLCCKELFLSPWGGRGGGDLEEQLCRGERFPGCRHVFVEVRRTSSGVLRGRPTVCSAGSRGCSFHY